MRIKHLEMIQAIISRMAGQGASLKNYCITLVTAVCGVSVSLKSPSIAVLALLPTLVFWLLDAQYLRMERQFRSLYDLVRQEAWDRPSSFKIDLKDAPSSSFWAAAGSWSLVTIYPAIAVVAVVVSFILRWAP